MATAQLSNTGHTKVPSEAGAEEKGSESTRETVGPESGLPKSEKQGASSRGWRFWAVFPPICLATLLIALESTVTTASLPKIAADLDAGDNYVWIMNGYLLTATVFIPFFGQFAFVFGRRWPTLFAVVMFMLGSGIAGGANSMAMLIAGRIVQGLGGAGVGVLGNIIVSDLTSVRERGKYLAAIFGVFGLGIAVGPPIGGAISQTNWRWVFATDVPDRPQWLNLPVGALALIMLFLFLHVDAPKLMTVRQGLKRVDWIGNWLLIGSVLSILIALSWADTRYPWASWRILVPLLVGFAGLVAFHAYEASPWCLNPTIPPRLFGNRTATVAFLSTFLAGALTFWRLYFMALYFEGVLLVSTGRSGVLLLPSVLVYVPAAVSGGLALSKWGRYKPIHLTAYGLIVLATGLYIDLEEAYSIAKIVIYQIIAGWGSGMLITTILPAAQAALPTTDAVPASALWAYLRSFGSIWGIAIPAAIFNSRFAQLSETITDEDVRSVLGGGNAYSHVSNTYVSSLPPAVKGQVVHVYNDSLRLVWYVCLGFSAFALLVTFLEKEVVMRTTLDAPQKDTSGNAEKDLESQGSQNR